MANVSTNIRIDADLKREAASLFEAMGTNLSAAVNLFLTQAVLKRKIPFEVSLPEYNDGILEAIEEARRISRDDSIPAYANMDDFIKSLEG